MRFVSLQSVFLSLTCSCAFILALGRVEVVLHGERHFAGVATVYLRGIRLIEIEVVSALLRLEHVRCAKVYCELAVEEEFVYAGIHREDVARHIQVLAVSL